MQPGIYIWLSNMVSWEIPKLYGSLELRNHPNQEFVFPTVISDYQMILIWPKKNVLKQNNLLLVRFSILPESTWIDLANLCLIFQICLTWLMGLFLQRGSALPDLAFQTWRYNWGYELWPTNCGEPSGMDASSWGYDLVHFFRWKCQQASVSLCLYPVKSCMISGSRVDKRDIFCHSQATTGVNPMEGTWVSIKTILHISNEVMDA